jgi:hypothetical protein
MKVKRAVQFGAVFMGLLLALAASSGSAFANGKDPGGGSGAPFCEPQTYMYQSGSNVYFNGWANCSSLSSYLITIGYGPEGKTEYAHVRCYPGSDQVFCGFNGVTRSVYNPSGSQHWCMATILDVQTASGKNDHKYSLMECHWY